MPTFSCLPDLFKFHLSGSDRRRRREGRSRRPSPQPSEGGGATSFSTREFSRRQRGGDGVRERGKRRQNSLWRRNDNRQKMGSHLRAPFRQESGELRS